MFGLPWIADVVSGKMTFVQQFECFGSHWSFVSIGERSLFSISYIIEVGPLWFQKTCLDKIHLKGLSLQKGKIISALVKSIVPMPQGHTVTSMIFLKTVPTKMNQNKRRK